MKRYQTHFQHLLERAVAVVELAWVVQLLLQMLHVDG